MKIRCLALALLCVLICQICPAQADTAQIPKKGDRGEEVRALQTRLSHLGFYLAAVDDVFGKQAELAVKRFQAHLNAMREDDALMSLFPEPALENGKLTGAQHEYLFSKDYLPSLGTLAEGDESDAVFRLQWRLDLLGYLDGQVNGRFDAETAHALSRFQRRVNLAETGIADLYTQRALFSTDAPASKIPLYHYRLYISNDDQRVYAYEWQGGGHTLPVRSMVCSTGLPNTPTQSGVYRSEGPVSRWCYFPIYACWAQYAYRIEGAMLFHSVLYARADEGTLKASSVKSLGTKSSNGCVRLGVEDAQWLYENCRAGTTVVIY